MQPLYVGVLSPHPHLSTPEDEPHSDVVFYQPKSLGPVIIGDTSIGIYFSFLLWMNIWAAFIRELIQIMLLRPFLNASLLARGCKPNCGVFTQEETCSVTGRCIFSCII